MGHSLRLYLVGWRVERAVELLVGWRAICVAALHAFDIVEVVY